MNHANLLPFTPRVYQAYSNFPHMCPNHSFDTSRIRYGFHWVLEPLHMERPTLKG